MAINIYILHYSDTETHPNLKVSNLALNELMLRCVASIHEFTKEKHRLILVDNGSPPEAHTDMMQLLKEHGYEEETIWVREKWHPVPVGANAALKHFLDTGSEYMVFLTSDQKIGVNFIELGHQFMRSYGAPTFAEPNIGPYYGIGKLDRYRTKAFWEKLRTMSHGAYSAEKIIGYCDKNGVKYVTDSWKEPAVVSSDTRPGAEGRRIGIFFANRNAVKRAGFYNEQYLRSSEFQYYYQALERGCQMLTMGYIYLGHIGGLFRTGVGSYNARQYSTHGPKGDLRFRKGKGNVFATKD